jgi:hypothetical protein
MLLQKRTKKSRKTYTQKTWCAGSRLNAGFFTYVTIEWASILTDNKQPIVAPKKTLGVSIRSPL